MRNKRRLWRRAGDDILADEPLTGRVPPPAFRSDNDLHAWRQALGLAIPLTSLSLGAWFSLGLPFRDSPAALIPAIAMVAFLRWRAGRDRRAGKRFSAYDADDLSV